MNNLIKNQNTIFELEQSILTCWNIVDDLELLCKRISDNEDFENLTPKQIDFLTNILLGMQEVYNMRFSHCFAVFEQVSKQNNKQQQIIKTKLSDIFDDSW